VTAVPEKAAQATMVDLATLLGWSVYHTFDSRSSASGFPDLVLARERLVFAEVKKVGQKPRPDQVEWLDALVLADCETYLWTIDDMQEIAEVLQSSHRLSGCHSSWERARVRLGAGGVAGHVGTRRRRAA
jgi:hypothetical protein